ncbi:uncharacterized protein LOC118744338 isoform X2 [Rhagoletis pomonella]|uniref:uncharacterized protein LOC118744338 isoform X2 n=1 Tax=Rhagoletis pomonella TaxID=28610 RepID=UPI001782F267|nr:uncharacterized protein LOC118744338 isoform X2 [Rhagoletis pomonella]
MFKLDFLYLVIFTGLTLASSCQLNVESPLPVLSKKFGSKRIVFKPLKTSIELKSGESVMAYCNNGIMYKVQLPSIPSYYSRYEARLNIPSDDVEFESKALEANSAEITCDSLNQIGIKGKFDGSSKNIIIFCIPLSSPEIYESKTKLINCGNYESYAIGVPLQAVGIGNQIQAGVCYDLNKSSLKFVTFVAHLTSDVEVVDERKATNELTVTLDEKIASLENYYKFMSQEAFDAAREAPDRCQIPLINAFKFDFASLLQDGPSNIDLNDYAYLFNIMWWRQLRQQNWRYFLDALRERTRSDKYLVYMGTYGNASLPSVHRNYGSFKPDIVSVSTENLTVNAPAYIWAYLKPLTHADEEEEFVVIAHNSPYVMNPGHTEFCSVDMCDKVEWLKTSTFGNLRRLPTLGYTFCCRPEEVAEIIKYFPMAAEKNESTQTTELRLTTEKEI